MKTLTMLLLKLMALLPRPVAQALGHLIGNLNYWTQSRAAQVTAVNLALCGQDPGLQKSSLQATGKTMMETPAVWLAATSRIDTWFGEIYGEAILRAAVDNERGVLILLPHLGNWELFNVFYRRYGNMTALYQPPGQPGLDEMMHAVRSRHGNEMVPTDRRGVMRLYRVLEEGGSVVILPDQVPASGRYIPFCGVDALTDELAARLVKKTNAIALMMAFVRRADGRFDVHISEVERDLYGETEPALASMNRMIESTIALAPEQYQWEYKRFRERPAGEKKVYRFNKTPGVHQ